MTISTSDKVFDYVCETIVYDIAQKMFDAKEAKSS